MGPSSKRSGRWLIILSAAGLLAAGCGNAVANGSGSVSAHSSHSAAASNSRGGSKLTTSTGRVSSVPTTASGIAQLLNCASNQTGGPSGTFSSYDICMLPVGSKSVLIEVLTFDRVSDAYGYVTGTPYTGEGTTSYYYVYSVGSSGWAVSIGANSKSAAQLVRGRLGGVLIQNALANG